MSFRKIDKIEYKQHLNRSQLFAALALLVLSLITSEVIRTLFADPNSSDHFWLNAASVALSVLILVVVFMRVRHHEYFQDIMYIWNLKQRINRIYGNNRHIEQGIQQDCPAAIECQHYYLVTSIYIYQLEDNTLTLSELSRELDQLRLQMQRLDLTFDVQRFDIATLERIAK